MFCGCAETVAAGVCDVPDSKDVVCSVGEASVDVGAASVWPLTVWVTGDGDREAGAVTACGATACRLTEETEGDSGSVGVAASVCAGSDEGGETDTDCNCPETANETDGAVSRDTVGTVATAELNGDEDGPASACAGLGAMPFDWSGGAY